MRTMIAIALIGALTGCASLPDPSEPLAPGNAQVRLSQISGHVEVRPGILTDGEAVGSSCVLTVLGRVPPGVQATMQQGACTAQVVGRE